MVASWWRGIVWWRPPHALKTEFLLWLALLGVAVILMFPRWRSWPGWLQVFCLTVVILIVGWVNNWFRSAGKK